MSGAKVWDRGSGGQCPLSSFRGAQELGRLLQPSRPLCLCPSGDEGEQQEEKEKAKLEFTESPSVYLLFDSTFCLCAPSMDPPPPPSAPPPPLPRPLSGSEGVPQNLLLLRGFSPFGLTLGSNPTDAPLTKRPFQRLPPPPPPGRLGDESASRAPQSPRGRKAHCLRWIHYRSLSAF